MKNITTILLFLLMSLSLFAVDDSRIDERSFEAYPNPTSGIIKLKDCHHIDEVKLYNLMGKKVEFEGSTCELSISNLPDGIYILKILSGDEVHTHRIVKRVD